MATSPHNRPAGDPTVARPTITALDPPLTPFALIGIVIWVGVGLLSLTAAAPADWRWASLAGALIGVGLAVVGWLRARR